MTKIVSALAAGAAALLTALSIAVAVSGGAVASADGGGHPWHDGSPSSEETVTGGGNPWYG
jgi:hypothetical protein